MKNWIKFRDRKPETTGRYLVRIELSNLSEIAWFDGCIFPGSDMRITHWMPLPEPPEQETRGPFSIIIHKRDETHAYDVWQVRLGEALSPQLQTQSTAQGWCDFLNTAWADDDHTCPTCDKLETDYCLMPWTSCGGCSGWKAKDWRVGLSMHNLYRTVGSKVWLDGLTDKQRKKLKTDIYPVLSKWLERFARRLCVNCQRYYDLGCKTKFPGTCLDWVKPNFPARV